MIVNFYLEALVMNFEKIANNGCIFLLLLWVIYAKNDKFNNNCWRKIYNSQ